MSDAGCHGDEECYPFQLLLAVVVEDCVCFTKKAIQ